MGKTDKENLNYSFLLLATIIGFVLFLSLGLATSARASVIESLTTMSSAEKTPQIQVAGSPTSTPVPTFTPTPIPSPTSTSTSTPDIVTSEELLAAYKDLVDANKQAVEAAHTTLNIGLTLAALVATIVTGVGAWSYKTAREAGREAKGASRMAASVLRRLKLLRKESEKLAQDLAEIKESKQSLQKELQALGSELGQGEQRVIELDQRQAILNQTLIEQQQQIESDTQVLERLYALAEVDRYAMHFFGDDSTNRTTGRKGLLQLSKNTDPIIRRECLRVFNVMPNYLEDWMDRDVMVRIDHMMHYDKERGIRKEAEAVMAKWQEQGGRRLKTILNEIRTKKS